MGKKTSSLLIVFLILLADQTLKFWVKTHMMLGQEFSVFGKWFVIHFVENNGMAFGFEFAGNYGKIFLSVFRIAAVVGIGWYLTKLWKRDVPFGLIVSVSLIMAGAIGNIIDSAFYGMIFSDSYGQVATLFPPGGGYSTFLHGRVVDMLYFPILEGHYPMWFPFWGGQQFIFFRPVFNLADSSITVGIFLILLFYRRFFDRQPATVEAPEASTTENIEVN
ncbi:lipoprotein signal peptidase [Prolixibacter sp. NT017]|uniref:lipoprotein signal peptidase n=1 Tax=Prolixibacter sp. NT017 TaxID=2652390 RepID=UPI00127CCC9B|nr:lipoprotein signal peptidase [Prolixibacter sp. NT017]GET27240.1 lipoprotein signal peptidase [Prolixibacter sp. NT017]